LVIGKGLDGEIAGNDEDDSRMEVVSQETIDC
jgi:hypothetical protein